LSKEEAGVMGLGLAALLALPGIGWIILGFLIFIIALFLGIGISIFNMLQNVGLLSAIVFGVAVAAILWIGRRTNIINEATTQKYPWMWLLIPGAALFGFIADRASIIRLTIVSSLSTASTAQAGVSVILFLIAVASACYLGFTLATAKKPSKKSKRKRR